MRKGADIKFRGHDFDRCFRLSGDIGQYKSVHAQETGMIQLECRGTSPHQKKLYLKGRSLHCIRLDSRQKQDGN